MANIDISAEKWARKAKAGIRKAARAVKDPASFEKYVRKVSQFSGIPEGTVRTSLPAQNWQDFAAHADEAYAIAERKIDAAASAGTWKRNYMAAFGG